MYLQLIIDLHLFYFYFFIRIRRKVIALFFCGNNRSVQYVDHYFEILFTIIDMKLVQGCDLRALCTVLQYDR